MAILALAFFTGRSRGAEGDAAPAQEPALPSAVREEIRRLEEKNRQLEDRVKSLEDGRSHGDATGAGEAGEMDEAGMPEAEATGLGMTASYRNVRAMFQLFGDVGFRYDNPEPDGIANSRFVFGSLDIFVTAQVGERFQALSETAITGHRDENDIRFTQERLWGSWTFHDYLYAKLGVEHSAVSHWNRLYHHGRWLEMTIDRPFLARFEGDGGILALHNTGLELGGALHGDLGRLEYVGTISNGRGETPAVKQSTIDLNNSKAFDFALSFSPACCTGLQFGGAGRYDEIPPDTVTPPDPDRAHSMRAFTGSAFIDLKVRHIEALAEFAYIENQGIGEVKERAGA